MEIVVISVAAIIGLLGLLTAIAFYRGWFRLISIANEDKVQFILMKPLKVVPLDAKPVLVPGASAGRSIANDLLSLPMELPEDVDPRSDHASRG